MSGARRVGDNLDLFARPANPHIQGVPACIGGAPSTSAPLLKELLLGARPSGQLLILRKVPCVLRRDACAAGRARADCGDVVPFTEAEVRACMRAAPSALKAQQEQEGTARGKVCMHARKEAGPADTLC